MPAQVAIYNGPSPKQRRLHEALQGAGPNGQTRSMLEDVLKNEMVPDVVGLCLHMSLADGSVVEDGGYYHIADAGHPALAGRH